MTSDLMKSGSNGLARGAGMTIGKEVGATLLKTGGGGLAIGGVAWLLPFITLPMLLVLAVVVGMVMYAKS